MNYLDLILCGIIGIFGVSSALRGFVQEFVSLIILIFALTLSYYVGSIMQPILLSIIKFNVISGFLSYSVSFLLALFGGNKLFSAMFLEMEFNRALDIMLGFVFGLIKSGIFIFLFFMVLDYIFIPSNQPEILKTSEVKSYIYHLKNLILDNHRVN